MYFVLRILEDDQRMQNTFSGKCTQLSAAEYAEINGAPKMNEYTSSKTVPLSTKPLEILIAKFSFQLFNVKLAHPSIFVCGVVLVDTQTKCKIEIRGRILSGVEVCKNCELF